jgi:hypothetical protein
MKKRRIPKHKLADGCDRVNVGRTDIAIDTFDRVRDATATALRNNSRRSRGSRQPHGGSE